jgi:hypothetical protein
MKPSADPYRPFPSRQVFSQGNRVRVAAAFGGWLKESVGVICGTPAPVQTVQGEDFFYWVQFDVPQFTADKDGPYEKAQILSCCLSSEA